MTTQFPLPYARSSVTSREAATSMRQHAVAVRELVYEALVGQAMTDEQLADALGRDSNTVRARRVELRDMGLVVDVGIGRTRSGRKATLWRAA